MELAAVDEGDLDPKPSLRSLSSDLAKLQAQYCVRSSDDLQQGHDGTQQRILPDAWGSGRNGKSVFTNILRYVMGDYATSTPMDTLTASTQPQHPTDLADLRGARLVTAQETQGGRRWAEAKIKQMTGGDPIKARFMRQDFFEYLPQFKLFIAGNHQPGLSTVDEAMRRRIHLLPFTVTIPKDKVDRKLEEKLRAEAPAILRWMLEGCLKWQTEGLEPPSSVRQATQEYLEGEDVIGRWITDCCTEPPTHKESVKLLHEAYVLWCASNGEHPMAKNSFSKAVRERGYASDITGGKRGFLGLQVRTDVLDALARRSRGQDEMPF